MTGEDVASSGGSGSSALKMNAASSFPARVTASLRSAADGGPVKQAPQFSMLHAAAITGDKVGLQKLASGNFCDIDLKDKVGSTLNHAF